MPLPPSFIRVSQTTYLTSRAVHTALNRRRSDRTFPSAYDPLRLTTNFGTKTKDATIRIHSVQTNTLAPQSVMQITEIISLLAQGPISTVGRLDKGCMCVSSCGRPAYVGPVMMRRLFGFCAHEWTNWQQYGLRRQGFFWVCHCRKCNASIRPKEWCDFV